VNEDQEQLQPNAMTVTVECGFCRVKTHIYADDQTGRVTESDIQALFTQLGWDKGFLLGLEFDICPTCVAEITRPRETA